MLNWETKTAFGTPYFEAVLGDFERHDGVRFSIQHQPTNNLRGPYLLLIESEGTWPTFDHADQPARYYHVLTTAKLEALLIAEEMVKLKRTRVRASGDREITFERKDA